ncbi:BA3454 family stress response protein [Peribacillus asahii]|uniref:BA3454 family stress response protein n=1 Tax=Peribacillus asahii TaxID=228899 RepID=A0A398B263_9BACI|nr:BA3454 family stress response protein [Peribacillus asahii]RID82978.1 BA3454 family stress response protein [Peribacillus asahii]USK61899.1 BA3454 family stress response protein [Peribacillus asahii]
MIEVFVTVNYKDKNYQTNVIVNKEMTLEKIKQLAEEQVIKQWDF